MIKWFNRKINLYKRYQQAVQNQGQQPKNDKTPISPQLEVNVAAIKQILVRNSDIAYRPFLIASMKEYSAMIIAIEGLFEQTAVNEDVIKPLMDMKCSADEAMQKLNDLENGTIHTSAIMAIYTVEECMEWIMKGDPVLLINGIAKGYVLGTPAWEMRGVSEPVTETVIRGPREGFVETLRVNTSMLRRKIHHPNFKIEQTTIGKYTQTSIVICYVEGIVNPDILDEVKKRLSRIEIDAIMESQTIEELIVDNPYTPYPLVGNSESPDFIASRLLEGRVAILIDGTPVALVVPYVFMEAFHTPDDYYTNYLFVSFLRMVRMFAFLVTVFTPAIYVAASHFQKEMFPMDLMISVAASREGTPFSLFIEVFVMLIVFEWLRESGVRLPRPYGQSVSIVGGLVLGEAAVNAGFVAAPTIIIIGISAISSFLLIALNTATSLLRLIYLVAASMFGMYGIIIVLTWQMLHLASLRSFGIPYLTPLAPLSFIDWKDFIIRVPRWFKDLRPIFLTPQDQQRQSHDLKPQPPKQKNR